MNNEITFSATQIDGSYSINSKNLFELICTLLLDFGTAIKFTNADNEPVYYEEHLHEAGDSIFAEVECPISPYTDDVTYTKFIIEVV